MTRTATASSRRATIFAEGLRFPMGITPYKGGLLVAVAPDLLYLEDTDGDGKADKTTVLYTGFNLANIQQMVNGLQWGLDNWVYGMRRQRRRHDHTRPQKPDAPPVSLRNRGFRFKPDVPGSLEPTSGGGQYGLTADDYQRWFTATNSQHLRQIVLPDHYLQRNPYLPVSAVTLDIPEHGAAAQVFRISPFEPWRVERTTRRAGGAGRERASRATELVPGGYITSACSPLIYTADLFPKEYRGNNFVCDPANNLIHRETAQGERRGLHGHAGLSRPRVPRLDRQLVPAGASDDRPGRGDLRPRLLPRGDRDAAVAAGRHQEATQPRKPRPRPHLAHRARRISRRPRMPDFTKLTPAQLADELASANPWRRITAQRLAGRRAGEGRRRRGFANCCRKPPGSPAA